MTTTSTTPLPTLGAAMPARMLETYRDWLIEGRRDLELQDFFKADVLNGDSKPLATEIRKQLDGHKGRLGIHGPFWGFSIASVDPDVRQVVRKRMMQALDACEEIGATQMVVHSPFTTWDYNNFDNRPGYLEDAFSQVHATLDDVVARAEQVGVTLVIENIEDIDPRWRVRLAESFASERVRVSIDTGHAHYAHGSTGAPPVDYYVVAAGNMLEHVHLQDADGYADRHWVPGEGTVRWPSVFRALSALSSNPRLIIEIRDHSRIFEAAEFLTKAGLAR
ncbi:sugar phosphate isomerase/epimerase family protein [Nisaea sediminum]|uniref:sugar phosphate isomerase/epimerase family protein n=1 Tax=Nisaea sediminum TaxID=2775867 RepID=UPI00186684B9|nr:sugar phosphate isomerase/epimerase family protein [Nisaea sediminum]